MESRSKSQYIADRDREQHIVATNAEIALNSKLYQPDGFILHVFGPVEGRRHDMTLYRESGIDSVLQPSMNIDGAQYCLYGDPAYCLRPYLQVGYQGSNLTPDQVHFNMSMSKVRIAVEWAFRDLKMYFTNLDFPRKLKMGVTLGGCPAPRR
jgi:nuclease HARBI1